MQDAIRRRNFFMITGKKWERQTAKSGVSPIATASVSDSYTNSRQAAARVLSAKPERCI
jgi:hypothetical protein